MVNFPFHDLREGRRRLTTPHREEAIYRLSLSPMSMFYV